MSEEKTKALEEENRGDIVGRLKSQGTGRLILLSLITFGIYAAHYIKRQTIIINQHLDEEHRIDENITSFILILSYMHLILCIPFSMFEEQWLEIVFDLLSWLWVIFVMTWAFKAGNRMNMLLANRRFIGMWTFLFHVWYFNYKINDLSNHTLASQLDSFEDKIHDLTNPISDNALGCYEAAGRLERKGQLKEALDAYDDIASRHADTDIGKDASISAEELRKRME